MATSAKYRPSLTEQELTIILDALQVRLNLTFSDVRAFSDCRAVTHKMRLFKFKSEVGLTAPSHITTEPLTAEQKLGFADDTSAADLFRLWKRVQEGEIKANFNPTQLTKINDYRFTNSLMSEEEELEYGESLMSRASGG